MRAGAIMETIEKAIFWLEVFLDTQFSIDGLSIAAQTPRLI